MCKLILKVDVFYCGKARRAITERVALDEALTHEFADKWQYNAENAFDANNVREMIVEQFVEYGIPAWEYDINIA